MAKRKLKITASEESIAKLKKALKAGAPLFVALEFAGISKTTFYYWVAMYSITLEAKNQDELENLRADEFGVSINQIKEMASDASPTKRSAMGVFIEPSAESMLQYRNNKNFQKFADECYQIVHDCNEARAEVALNHLGTILKSTVDKRVSASGSMWFLERTFSDYFSKPNEKTKEELEEKVPVQKVEVEFIDANKKEDKDRIKNMEELILHEQKGVGES